MAETPCVARAYCPGCEPDADPIGQILVVRWCMAHEPARDGADDAVASLSPSGTVTIEAGGTDNQHWCALLHRERSGGVRVRSARRTARRPTPPSG